MGHFPVQSQCRLQFWVDSNVNDINPHVAMEQPSRMTPHRRPFLHPFLKLLIEVRSWGLDCGSLHQALLLAHHRRVNAADEQSLLENCCSSLTLYCCLTAWVKRCRLLFLFHFFEKPKHLSSTGPARGLSASICSKDELFSWKEDITLRLLAQLRNVPYAFSEFPH